MRNWKLFGALAVASLVATSLVVVTTLAQPRPGVQDAPQPLMMPPDAIRQLQQENAVLVKHVQNLEARLAAAESAINGLGASKENRHYYAGFSHSYITKLNWNGIPDNALIEYWAPNR